MKGPRHQTKHPTPASRPVCAALLLLATLASPAFADGDASASASASIRIVIPPRVTLEADAATPGSRCAVDHQDSGLLRVVDDSGREIRACDAPRTDEVTTVDGIRQLTVVPV
jgi:hypothetical protein